MSVVEKLKISETEIQIFDDCCVSREDVEQTLKEIAMLTKGFFEEKKIKKAI